MKHFFSLFPAVLLFVTIILPVCPSKAQTSQPSVSVVESYNSQLAAALLFTENKGQVVDATGNLRPDILFSAHSNGAKVFVTATGISYQFEKVIFPQGYEPGIKNVKDHRKQEALRKQAKTETHRFSLSLQGANATPKVRKEGINAYTENFYLAHCPNGITGVHTYNRVVLENVYPGIDWVIYSKGKGLEYDFIVSPGANPSVIKLKVNDAQAVQIAEDGGLVMRTALGEVKEAAPVSYCGSERITTAFRMGADGTISFAIAAWDITKPLVVDPSVSWATYYGGTGLEFGYTSSVDASGNAYLAGITTSTTSVASGGFQNTFGGNFDAFLVKFSSTGTRLWATYYGGSVEDAGYFCATDGSGNVYLGGGTSSTSGIASGGHQNTFGGDVDAFLIKFTSTGTRIWSTYYGSSGEDVSYGGCVDASGNVYLAGETTSASGIASGGFQNTYSGNFDAFLVKFSSTGVRLWATYYGGTGGDASYSTVVDASGNVFLSGDTQSASGIASGGFQNTLGGSFDAFLVKFSSTGTRLWATYYGSTSYDANYSCATDGSGNVYLSGETESTAGIASGGFQNTYGGGDNDGFLVKFSSTGTRLWATYYGGALGDVSFACTTDGTSNVYLSGITESLSGIAFGGFQNMYGGGDTDGFLVKFNTSGVRQWGTYYGGNGVDECTFCKADAAGNVYLPGHTESASGIATGGFQNTYGGLGDAFLAKINDANPVPIKLISFTAQKDGTARNRIQWRTVMETARAKFEVERSADGYRFTTMLSVAGKSESGAAYTVFDNNPFSAVSYYRLKAVELDGTITYSNVVAVRSDGKNLVTVAPVPANTSITITNANTVLNGTKAIVTDMQGREVYRFIVAGVSFINVSNWASGVYNLRLADETLIRLMKE